ncbi:hypothetical protein C0585_07885 [Candidatus Woesearchaeota archaeon]|nr:MAG: hypothetical protein C0585_07885 [Candidatus Woesearchaeota archaeon]
MKYESLKDWKKNLQLLAIEFFSLTGFLALVRLFAYILQKYLPTTPFDPNLLQSLSKVELMIAKDQLYAYVTVYLVLLLLIFVSGFLIFNLTRKLIWEKIMNGKYSLKGSLKYSLQNTSVIISLFILITIAYLIFNWILGMISYIISFIPEVFKVILFQLVPILILFYLMVIYFYVFNSRFIGSKKDFFDVLKTLKEVNLKKYLLYALLLFIISYALNFLVYFIPPVMIATIGLLIFSAHNLVLKLLISENESLKGETFKKSKTKKNRRVKKS